MIEAHTKTYWELSRLLRGSIFPTIRHKAYDGLLDLALTGPTNRLRDAAKDTVASVMMKAEL